MCAPGSKEWKRRLSWMRTAFYVATVAMATYAVLQNVVAYEVAVLVMLYFGGNSIWGTLLESSPTHPGVHHDSCIRIRGLTGISG